MQVNVSRLGLPRGYVLFAAFRSTMWVGEGEGERGEDDDDDFLD